MDFISNTIILSQQLFVGCVKKLPFPNLLKGWLCSFFAEWLRSNQLHTRRLILFSTLSAAAYLWVLLWSTGTRSSKLTLYLGMPTRCCFASLYCICGAHFREECLLNLVDTFQCDLAMFTSSSYWALSILSKNLLSLISSSQGADMLHGTFHMGHIQ